MKKGKITVSIMLTLVCFVLFTVIFMQFKVVNETDITSIEAMREEELRTELANWKQKYKEAETQYNEKIEKLNDYKENEQSSGETSKLVEEELKEINTNLGKTDVEAEGITITIKDANAKESDVDPIGAVDLLIIIDYLKVAGAEAISINDQRIINMSDIVVVGDSIIYVNQERILAPYIIKAIGDPTKLESTLMGKGGFIEELKNLGFDIEIEKSDKISIPRFSKDIKYKYMKENKRSE